MKGPSELEQHLVDNGKSILIHAGFLTGRCVAGTVIGGSILGYNNIILGDLIANPLGKDLQNEEQVMRDLLEDFYCPIIDSSEVVFG